MTHQSLHEIAQSLRSGAIRASSLAAASNAAYDASEPRLNAYKHWAGAQMTQQAEAVDVLLDAGSDTGPLMGIPVSVKDLYGVPNMPVFAGTDAALPARWQAAGPVVQAVMGQLGMVCGKTHTVEFAYGGMGTNAHWGAPVNPWSAMGAPRAPGGSSAGAGVSLAQGTALVALGTDTAGSVRVPAALTGQCALQTSRGRWSREGIVPLSPSLDSPGILCRTVEDLAYAFGAIDRAKPMAAQGTPVSGLRIGIIGNTVWDGADASIAQSTRDALGMLERKGAVLADITLPHLETALEIFGLGGLAAVELRSFMEMNFPERIARLDPMVRARVETADQVTAIEYLRRASVLAGAALDAVRVFDEVDVLITPTVAISAPPLADLVEPGAYRQANMMTLRNTAFVNLFGWCALSMPSGLDHNGIPVGLQMIAPARHEEALLGMALGVEAVIGRAPELLGRAPLAPHVA
ncbi:amidase [Albirhodobacter sp. R86504]|uniref:amidase n=1 Tax=Albirhodobacter sp. R86504 TaxID=3093848 RepID=UPI00366DD325